MFLRSPEVQSCTGAALAMASHVMTSTVWLGWRRWALSLFALAFSPARAEGFAPSQKTEIESIIKDYLLKNPEILRDAINCARSARKGRRDEGAPGGRLGRLGLLYSGPIRQ